MRSSPARRHVTVPRLLFLPTVSRMKIIVLAASARSGPDRRYRRAHVNTACFCYSDDLELYFLSHSHSLHCRNLKARPTMALAVFEPAQRWGERDRGLHLVGACRSDSRDRSRSSAPVMVDSR